jgi:hypothetical protein
MTTLDIARQRLYNQRLTPPTFETPADVVAWLGAMQAQDYPGALWSLGLRMRNATESMIEQAMADKTIVRTWPMRGTLHFVAPADARWMLALLTPRIIAGSARRRQQLELDEATIARSKELFAAGLEGGMQLTRKEMYQLLAQAGISTAGQRGYHMLARAAQDGLICFGAPNGKEQTFALLDEWAPQAKTLTGDEALAELARRYFTSRGPATLQDFMWWSGLAAADAKRGLQAARPALIQETVDGRVYWLSPDTPGVENASPTVYLLPGFDEYLLGYRDRSAALDPAFAQRVCPGGNGVFFPTIVVDGQVVGTWKRTLKKDKIVMTPSPFYGLSGTEHDGFAEAAEHYGAFIGLPVTVS